jgi:parallel beta-helix repeat protein
MDTQSESRFPDQQLMPDEKVIYQSPRNWSSPIEPVFEFLLAMLLGFGYSQFSVWSNNIITIIRDIPMFATQPDVPIEQVNILRWGMLILAAIFLISSILQFAAFWGVEIMLTDRRILGRTGRFILRQVNIPIDNISWMDFPNKNLSKGPISIHARDRKKTTLWNLYRPEIFLEFLTSRYSPETMPVINKDPSRRSALGVLVVFILLGVGAYYIYTFQVKKPEVAAIYLKADGSGDYPTLEKAVQHIAEGGTITLGAGTYRLSQPLEINKPISLIGAGMDQTIVVTTTEYYVISFNGEGSFVLQGLTAQLVGGGKANVVQIKNGDINFSDCRFTGDGNNGPGLLVLANAKGTVKNCESINNGMHGFSIQDQAHVILENNKCTNNEEGGIGFFNNAQGTARQNECTGNKHGIYVADQARADLEENITSDNQEIGIFYSDNTSGTARLNECSRNGNSGIWVTDQAKVTLEENTCSINGGDGIVFSGNTKGVARKNVCSKNVKAGISANEQAEPILVDNTCMNNKVGISFHDFAKGTARGNQCSGNEYGISIYGQSQPLLEGNITTENSSAGIYYLDKAGGIARQNDCSRNDMGIAVLDQSQPELEQNTCNDNKVSGIGYSGSAGGSAIQNECSRNTGGIAVIQQAQPVLEGNVCTENEYGIFIDSLANPELRENDCHNNTKKNIWDKR